MVDLPRLRPFKDNIICPWLKLSLSTYLVCKTSRGGICDLSVHSNHNHFQNYFLFIFAVVCSLNRSITRQGRQVVPLYFPLFSYSSLLLSQPLALVNAFFSQVLSLSPFNSLLFCTSLFSTISGTCRCRRRRRRRRTMPGLQEQLLF